MKSNFSSYFSSVIPTLFSPVTPYIKTSISKVINFSSKKNQDQIPLRNFLHDSDEYNSAISKLTIIGTSKPSLSINLMLQVFPFSDKKLIFEKMLNDFKFENEQETVGKEVFRVFGCYVFADVVAQLLTWAKSESLNQNLLDSLVNILKQHKQYPEQHKAFFKYHFKKIIKQCSVIISILSISSYEQIYKSFVFNLEQVVKMKYLLLLYRFIRFDNDSANSHLARLIDLYNKGKKKSSNIEIPLHEFFSVLRFPLIQVTDFEEKIENEIKSILKNEKDSKETRNSIIECKAIILSKSKNLTEEQILEFSKATFKSKAKPESMLKTFLYLIRNGKMNINSIFWCYGEFNQLSNLGDDCSMLWIPSYDSDALLNFFSIYIMPHSSSPKTNSLISSILFNFVSRNTNSISNLISNYFQEKNLQKILPLLTVLTNMINEDVNFTLYASKNPLNRDPNLSDQKNIENLKDKIHTFLTTIKTSLFNYLSLCKPNSYSNIAISPHFISSFEVQEKPSPDFRVISDEFVSNLSKDMDHCDMEMRSKLGDMHFKRVKFEISVLDNFNTKDNDKAIIHLLCLLAQIVNQNDLKDPKNLFFQILFESTLSKSQFMAYFSIYTIQWIYFQINYSRNILLSSLTSFLMNKLEGYHACTLLSLYYHLISSSVVPLRENDKIWFDDWCNNFQAMILYHLSSPYLEIHRLAMLSLKRFQFICDQNNVSETIYNELEKKSEPFMIRLSSRYPLDNYSFEDICYCSSIILYSLAYSEFLCLLSQGKFNKIIDLLIKMKLPKYIVIPKSCDNDENIAIYINSLYISVLCSRLLFWKKETYQNIQNDLPKLNPINYINLYQIEESFVTENNLEIENDFKNIICNLIDDSLNSISSATEFINILIMTGSCLSQSIVLNGLISKLKSIQNNLVKSISGLVQISDFILKISNHPDYQLLICSSSASFYNIKFFLLLIQECNEKNELLYQNYTCILKNTASSLASDYNPGSTGSLHRFEPLILLKSFNWPINQRQQSFKFLIEMPPSKFNEEAEISMFHVGKLFDDNFVFSENIQKIASCSDKVLKKILALNPNLFDLFCEKSYKGEEIFFRALAFQYVGEINNNSELSEYDKKYNIETFKKRGILFLLAFLFLSSPDIISRILAFKLLKRLCPIISTLYNSKELASITYLNEKFKEIENEFTTNVSIPTIGKINSLFYTVCKYLPFLKYPILQEAIEKIKKNSGTTLRILTLISNITNLFRINEMPFSLILSLIELYYVLPDSLCNLYCSLFTGFCQIQENLTNLVKIIFNLLVQKKFEKSCVSILISLSSKHLIKFVSRAVQPMQFDAWFLQNIYESEVVLNLPQEEKTTLPLHGCLLFFDEIMSSSFSNLLNYIPTILHFCLLYSDDKKYENYFLVRSIIHKICNNLNIKENSKQMITFNSQVSPDEISITKIVSHICSSLKDIYQNAIEIWYNLAIQWLCCCGDLSLATKSAIILCNILLFFDGNDILPVMSSINSILSNSLIDSNDPIVLNYLSSSLNVILYMTKSISAIEILENYGNFIWQFSKPFIEVFSTDSKVLDIIFQILQQFIPISSVQKNLNLESNIKQISLFIYNKNLFIRAMNFLTTIARYYPCNSEIKIISIILQIPIFYNAFYAYQCVSQYANLLTTKEIEEIFKIAKRICSIDFGTESKISSIFSEYMSEPDSQDPELFLDKIITELCKNYSNEIEKCGEFFSNICKKIDNIKCQALYNVVQKIIIIGNSNSISLHYIDFIRFACEQNKDISDSFLYPIILSSKQDGPFASKLESDDSQSEKVKTVSDLIAEIEDIISHVVIPKGEITINDQGIILPMIPLYNDAWKSQNENQIGLSNIVIQPYASQKLEWKTISSISGEIVEPNVENNPQNKFDFYMHSTIGTLETRESVDSIDVPTLLPPEFFIVCYVDYPQYESRIH